MIPELPKVGERIRVAIMHGGQWRPLLWLRVGKDGSLYLGLLLNQPSYGTIGAKGGSGSQIRVNYGEGNPVTAEDLKKGSRVSFKVSGEIHMGAAVHPGPSLQALAKPVQLCIVAFVHPLRYRPPPHKTAKRDYDIGIVDYPVDDSRPMYGSIWVGPWDGGQVEAHGGLKSMDVWQSFAFGFSGLRKAADYYVSATIGHGLVGTWPPLPYVVVVSERNAGSD
jgi:hypothetical protein